MQVRAGSDCSRNMLIHPCSSLAGVQQAGEVQRHVHHPGHQVVLVELLHMLKIRPRPVLKTLTWTSRSSLGMLFPFAHCPWVILRFLGLVWVTWPVASVPSSRGHLGSAACQMETHSSLMQQQHWQGTMRSRPQPQCQGEGVT